MSICDPVNWDICFLNYTLEILHNSIEIQCEVMAETSVINTHWDKLFLSLSAKLHYIELFFFAERVSLQKKNNQEKKEESFGNPAL